MMTYKINEYIELRLENDETAIYINGQEFIHCKYLLFNIDTNKPEPRDTLVSIDELKEYYSNEHESNKEIEWLTPEVEFFGHCSNLQAWIENDFNPNLLHSNLSVPLLSHIIAFDVKALSKLLYHLDNYWISYEKCYSEKFTRQRREALLEQYSIPVMRAIEYHQLFEYIELSPFLLNVRLLEVLPKMFPFAFEVCEWCNEKKLRYKQNYKGFQDFILYNDCFDDSDYTTYHICDDCYEHIYDNDIEWCETCECHYENSYHRNVIYIECIESVVCKACYKNDLLKDGLASCKEIHDITEIDFTLTELLENDYKYVCSYTIENIRSESLFMSELQEFIDSGCSLLIWIESIRSRIDSIYKVGVFIKSEKEIYRFNF